MYGELLKQTDRDGLLHWITNGENCQPRFIMNLFPNLDSYDDAVNPEQYYFRSDDTEDEDTEDAPPDGGDTEGAPTLVGDPEGASDLGSEDESEDEDEEDY